MLRSRWNSWLSGVGGVVLIGGLGPSNYGGGIMPAEAHDHEREAYNHYPNPFKQILDKLNEILAKLKDGAGAGAGAGRWGRGGESYVAVGHQECVGLALYRLGGLWRRGCIGQQHRPGVATIAGHDEDHVERCPRPMFRPANRRRARVAAALTAGIDESEIHPSLPAPFVPSVFTGVQLDIYWSATTVSDNTNNKWSVDYSSGLTGLSNRITASNYYLCVRGPMQESVY